MLAEQIAIQYISRRLFEKSLDVFNIFINFVFVILFPQNSNTFKVLPMVLLAVATPRKVKS